MAAKGENPRVTICIPVYNGAEWLGATLDAVRAQTYRRFRVLLSVDGGGGDDGSREICRTAAGEDPRIAWSERPERLGWVDNLNHLFDAAETEFACFLPQDDTLAPEYLAKLVAVLDARPETVLAYCDIDTEGGLEGPLRPAPSITGRRATERVLAALTGHYAAVAARGLLRTQALKRAGRLRRNPVEDLAADAVFLVQMAREGDLTRLPEMLYRKRYHDRNTHAAWTALPEPRKLEGWWHHVADATEEALNARGSAQEMRLVWLAGVARLLSPEISWPLMRRDHFTKAQIEALLDGFLTRMESSPRADVPFLLDTDWERARRLARSFAWNPPERQEIVAFGPQPVNAKQPFHPQADGHSALWVQTRGRVAPGTQIRLGDRVLKTAVRRDTATALVPPGLTDRPGELPLVLVDGAGTERSNRETFWVLRATPLGRSLVRLVRRLRGQPDPAAVPALPPPRRKG